MALALKKILSDSQPWEVGRFNKTLNPKKNLGNERRKPKADFVVQ